MKYDLESAATLLYGEKAGARVRANKQPRIEYPSRGGWYCVVCGPVSGRPTVGHADLYGPDHVQIREVPA